MFSDVFDVLRMQILRNVEHKKDETHQRRLGFGDSGDSSLLCWCFLPFLVCSWSLLIAIPGANDWENCSWKMVEVTGPGRCLSDFECRVLTDSLRPSKAAACFGAIRPDLRSSLMSQ